MTVPNCPECGRPMQLRTARRGPNAGGQFWGCTGYPKCDGTRDAAADAAVGEQACNNDAAQRVRVTVPNCPECGRSMQLRTARRGPNAGGQFWGCTGYPTCRGARDAAADVAVGQQVSNNDTAQRVPAIARSIVPRPIIVAASSSQRG